MRISPLILVLLISGFSVGAQTLDTAPLLVLEENAQDIYSVAYSPVGQHIATGGKSGSLNLWNAETGEALNTFTPEPDKRHPNPISAILFTPDGTQVLVVLGEAGWEGYALLLDPETSEIKQVFEDYSFGSGVSFSPDGTKLILGSTVFDTATGESVSEIVPPHRCAAFEPSGTRIFSVGHSNQMTILDQRTGEEPFFVKQMGRGDVSLYTVHCIAVSSDSMQMLAGGDDGAWTWFAGHGFEDCNIDLTGTEIRSAAFSPDGTIILTGGGKERYTFYDDSTDTGVRLWDAKTGQLLRIYMEGSVARAVAFSPDGTKVLAGGFGPTNGYPRGWAKVWDVSDLQASVSNWKDF